MLSGRSGDVLRGVRCLYGRGTVVGVEEGRLLERFVSRRDEDAFEALVARYGPMVLGVCRRRLDDRHDVEDAFQATFLILVRKAATIRDGGLLGNWLYGVACRVSTRARLHARRRRSREVAGAEEIAQARREPPPGEALELGSVLDEELGRLPEKYRTPLVLCNLQGQTYEETARQLNCPIGTVRSRTAKARALMRSRLVRRGITLPSAALAAALTPEATQAAIPPSLSVATVAAAARVLAKRGMTAGVVSASVDRLTREALTAMFRIKSQWVLVAVVSLATGAGVIAVGARGARPEAGQTGEDALKGKAKPAEQAQTSTDHATIVALERRLQDIERKLDALLAQRQDGSSAMNVGKATGADAAPNAVRKIRPRFDCLVEKVWVEVGQSVKKGDPLVDVFSADLAAAKGALLTKTFQWSHDRKLSGLRKKLYADKAISEQMWVDTQNDEEKSRHELGLAQDRLFMYGLTQPEIDSIKTEEGEAKARFTLRSPVDGKVTGIVASPQDLYKAQDLLIVIAVAKPLAGGN